MAERNESPPVPGDAAPAAVPPAAAAAPAPASDALRGAGPDAAAAPAPVEAPAAAPAAPSVELTTDKPSLLEGLGKDAPNPADGKPAEAPADAKPADAKPAEKPADKPADAAAPDAAKPADAKPAEPEVPAEPIVYEFKLPEQIKADDERMGAFTGLLTEIKAPAEIGQKLLDLHATAMQTYADALAQETSRTQHRVFNEMRDGWGKEIMADPVIGGAGHQTAIRSIARMRDMLVPKELMAPRKHEDGSPRLSAFEEFLRITGAGDHPVFHRILHNAARYLDEPQAEETPRNIKPPAGNGKRPGGFIEAMYDNPRSNPTSRG